LVGRLLGRIHLLRLSAARKLYLCLPDHLALRRPWFPLDVSRAVDGPSRPEETGAFKEITMDPGPLWVQVGKMGSGKENVLSIYRSIGFL